MRVGAAIHSVRAVPRESIGAVVRAAEGLPLHVHLSEQPAENDACLGFYGVTPTGLLDAEGALGPRTTAVHATHLTPGDLATLGRTGTTCCFCPTTERDLADGIGPARALLDAGSPLCLGSDQHAVVDLLEEARALEMHERLVTLQRGRFRARRAARRGHRAREPGLGGRRPDRGRRPRRPGRRPAGLTPHRRVRPGPGAAVGDRGRRPHRRGRRRRRRHRGPARLGDVGPLLAARPSPRSGRTHDHHARHRDRRAGHPTTRSRGTARRARPAARRRGRGRRRPGRLDRAGVAGAGRRRAARPGGPSGRPRLRRLPRPPGVRRRPVGRVRGADDRHAVRRRRHRHHGARPPGRRPTTSCARCWRRWSREMRAQGTTTVEVKSGYGLTVADEARACASPAR